jgi:type IV secretory pathway protease TraF
LKFLNKLINNKLKVFVGTFLTLIICLTASTLIFGRIFYENVSSSAPKGIYMASLFQVMKYGDYYIVSMPRSVGNVSMGYLMLKKLCGFPGDRFFVDDYGLVIGTLFYPVLPNRSLPHLDPGHFTVPDGSYLFLNDPYNSFDSRYIGPISKANVQKKVFLLIPYEPFYKIGRWVHEKMS